ncbi:MAG: hypothetical protein JXR03_20760 [Cyclobacteriaceae bacterium]
MKKISAVLLVVLVPLLVYSHTHFITTYSIHKSNGLWVMKVNAAQSSLNKNLPQYFPEVDFSNISKKEYNELVVQYFQENICLVADDKYAFPLGGAAVRLGGHQTDLLFELGDMPADASILDLEIYCFSKTSNQQNIVKVATENGRSYVISEKTEFKMSIDL